METLETITYKGYDINIHPDYHADDPREWNDRTILVLFHNRYNLPNELNIDHNHFSDWEEMEAFIEREYDPAIMRRVSMYEHGGIALSIGAPTCQWDSGYVGFMLVTKESIREMFNIKRVTKQYIERAYEIMKGELETYNDYLSGNVYGYTVDGDDWEDSVWGFYGYDHEENGLLDCAKSEIDFHIEQQAKNRNNRLKDFIRNNVPFHVRQMELA